MNTWTTCYCEYAANLKRTSVASEFSTTIVEVIVAMLDIFDKRLCTEETLYDAALKGDCRHIKRSLSAGISPNTVKSGPHNETQTALLAAAGRKKRWNLMYQAMELLLAAGADPNLHGGTYFDVLGQALQTTRDMLQYKKNLIEGDERTVSEASEKVVRLMVRHGYRIHEFGRLIPSSGWLLEMLVREGAVLPEIPNEVADDNVPKSWDKDRITRKCPDCGAPVSLTFRELLKSSQKRFTGLTHIDGKMYGEGVYYCFSTNRYFLIRPQKVARWRGLPSPIFDDFCLEPLDIQVRTTVLQFPFGCPVCCSPVAPYNVPADRQSFGYSCKKCGTGWKIQKDDPTCFTWFKWNSSSPLYWRVGSCPKCQCRLSLYEMNEAGVGENSQCRHCGLSFSRAKP